MFGLLRAMFRRPAPPKLDILCSRSGAVIVKRGHHVVQEIGPETVMAIYDAVHETVIRAGRPQAAKAPAPAPKTEPTLTPSVTKRAARGPAPKARQ